MLTLPQFIAIYAGKRVQAPGGFGGQCVDLTELWRLNLGGSRVYRNAGDFAGLAIPNMTWTANTPTNVPESGDVIVWAINPSMPDGHIAICVNATVMTFQSFDQNWPLGSPAHLQNHGYWDVAGWQRPLGVMPPTPTPTPSPGPGGGGGDQDPIGRWLEALVSWLRRLLGR